MHFFYAKNYFLPLTLLIYVYSWTFALFFKNYLNLKSRFIFFIIFIIHHCKKFLSMCQTISMREKMFFQKTFPSSPSSKHELLSRIPTSTTTFLLFPHVWGRFLRNLSCFCTPTTLFLFKEIKLIPIYVYALRMKNVLPLFKKMKPMQMVLMNILWSFFTA